MAIALWNPEGRAAPVQLAIAVAASAQCNGSPIPGEFARQSEPVFPRSA